MTYSVKLTLKIFKKQSSCWVHEGNGLGKRRIDMRGQFKGHCSNLWQDSDSRMVAVEAERSR